MSLLLNRNTNPQSHLVLFIFNRNQEQNFNKMHIIDKIEGRVTFENFKNLILKHIESSSNINDTRDSIKEGSTNKQTIGGVNSLKSKYMDDHNIDYSQLSEADLIEIQKRQLEELEREEINKVKNQEKKKSEELQRKKEEEEKALRQKQLIEEKRKTLPPEPEEGNKEASLIIFRYPHIEQRVQRRFLKTDKIQALYDFVCSLGTDIFEENGEFELLTPFPPKIFSDHEKTLVEEGLFPNAVLQIREI